MTGFWLPPPARSSWGAHHFSTRASLLVNRRARRAKTIRIDVERICERLAVICAASPRMREAWCWVSERRQEDARAVACISRAVTADPERVQPVNRIKGLWATQGI